MKADDDMFLVWVYMITFVLGCVAGALVISSKSVSKESAIKAGVAQYNPTNAAFEFITK